MSAENPYASPNAAKQNVIIAVDSTWYLTRIQKYFRRMGIGALVYIGVVIVFTITSQLPKGNFRIPQTVGPLVWCLLLAWLFVTMIRIGRLPEEQFPKHYKKARWVAIIAGTLFFQYSGCPLSFLCADFPCIMKRSKLLPTRMKNEPSMHASRRSVANFNHSFSEAGRPLHSTTTCGSAPGGSTTMSK
jgi:hypothetical protein